MKRVNSVSFRLSAIFFSFFFIIVVLGLFGIRQLSNFNRASSDLGTRWLPKTRFIGDLNNYTSDLRAAEASSLLSLDSEQFGAIEKETAEISRSISTAMQRYEQIPQGADEVDLYGKFIGKWNNYLKFVDQEKLLARAGRKAEATHIYMTASQTAYNAASDMLGNLTDRNVAYAVAATKRVDEAYQQARWLISAAMLFVGALITAAILYMKRSISRPTLPSMIRISTSKPLIDTTKLARWRVRRLCSVPIQSNLCLRNAGWCRKLQSSRRNLNTSKRWRSRNGISSQWYRTNSALH